MERQDVITILEALANGTDPASGEPLEVAALRSANTIRALFTAAAAIRDFDVRSRRSGRNSGTFVAAGAAWSKHEEARLCQELDKGFTLAQIALAHGRSSRAITMRLVKLGRIPPAALANSAKVAS